MNITRDCLDPWLYSMLGVDGAIRPCCWRPPIAGLNSEDAPAQVCRGDEIQALRAGLLSGDLDEHCARCENRRFTSVHALRRRFLQEVVLRGNVAQQRVCNERGEETIVRQDVRPNLSALADRIFLHPNPPGMPAAVMTFRAVDLTGCEQMDVAVYLEHPKSKPVTFAVEVLADGQSQLALEKTVCQPCSDWHARLPTRLAGPVDVRLSTRMAPGVRDNTYAWAYFDYPLFY